MKIPITIDDMLNLHQWHSFIESRLGNDLFISDPDRADRMHEAAEHGADGSTHYEIIEDWRDFARDLFRSLSMDERDDEEKNYETLMDEINSCEEYHDGIGTLHNQVGS
jgi:hypothetical protein